MIEGRGRGIPELLTSCCRVNRKAKMVRSPAVAAAGVRFYRLWSGATATEAPESGITCARPLLSDPNCETQEVYTQGA